MKRKGKVILILLIVTVLLAAAAFGIWTYLQKRNAEPVKVFQFQHIGMTEYWGDSLESYGPVTTDRIQTVFLSDTQTVVEVLVKQGDTVKKGDLLMTFDTTLSDLALERKRLEVEKLKLQLENAKEELKNIKNMKPMVIPTVKPDKAPKPDQGTEISGNYQISTNKKYDGSALDKSLILWLKDSVNLEDAVFEAVRVKAEEYQESNAPAPTEPPAEETTAPEEVFAQTTDTPEEPTTEQTAEPTGPSVDLTVDQFFMVVKVTEGNMSLGYNKVWQGMEVTKSGDSFHFKFFDAGALKDHTVTQQTVTQPTTPQIDFGSGYTSAQIAQMRSEQEKKIKELQFQIKMAEADYAIKQTEADSGQIIAQIDGTVVSLLTEEEAKQSQQPIMKLSGGGGFYVEGTVSELEKDNLQIGQEVTVNDWNTGMEHTGVVHTIGDFPAPEGNWNGMGNPTASYYPFTVYVDGSANLQEGSYVNIVYSTATTQQGIYLENPFLRTEQGKTYVYVRGSDGLLEKRFVTAGKSLWGSYTQILAGLSAEDMLAFPYGKNVAEGADTVESDLSELYG